MIKTDVTMFNMLYNKIFGKKETSTEIQKYEEPPSIAVVVKGEKHFDIYQDGNGYYKAQHVSGDWLDESNNGRLTDFFSLCYKTKELVEIEKKCMFYINSKLLTKVGTIEFIPSK